MSNSRSIEDIAGDDIIVPLKENVWVDLEH